MLLGNGAVVKVRGRSVESRDGEEDEDNETLPKIHFLRHSRFFLSKSLQLKIEIFSPDTKN